ncbi:MAG: type II toxin-antitoxin system HicB family antitoxin [Clostridia bacterium]|nr:MAG: type II toxin-antitoxin system HicB family antitoxin [Clostridia bacterium]
MERGFKVVLEWDREGNAYHVSVPALPGCFTYGRTREEALQRAREAIQGHLKGLKLIGEPVPEGDVDIDEVLVNIT